MPRHASSPRTASTFLVSTLRLFAPALRSAYARAFSARARPCVLSCCISRFWARPAPAHIVLLVSRLCRAHVLSGARCRVSCFRCPACCSFACISAPSIYLCTVFMSAPYLCLCSARLSPSSYWRLVCVLSTLVPTSCPVYARRAHSLTRASPAYILRPRDVLHLPRILAHVGTHTVAVYQTCSRIPRILPARTLCPLYVSSTVLCLSPSVVE